MLERFIAVAALAAGAVFPTDVASVQPRTVRVILPAGCADHCACVHDFLMEVHTSDICVDMQFQNFTQGEDGCCGELEEPLCENETPDACLAEGRELRMALEIDPCTCTSMDWSGSGTFGGGQTGLGAGTWSSWIQRGNFSLKCGKMAGGNITATCTAGGTPVPRTLVNIDYSWW